MITPPIHPAIVVPASAPARSDARAEARRLASRVLIELDLAGVAPTPRYFELWHVHLSGAKPELSQSLARLLRQSSPPPASALDAIYARHIAPDSDEHAASEHAEALRQEAEAMVENATATRVELQRYGQALSDCTVELSEHRSVESLTQAVAALIAETARVSERNFTLQHQLTAATARIGRLRDSLSESRREATTDTLTGLCNRKAFDTRLRRAVATARGENLSFSVLLLDIDHFKLVNDTYGHHVGDLVLRLIGRLLSENVKGRDTAARYGGEEFGIILAGANRAAAGIVAEQIRAALQSKSLAAKANGQRPTSVTVSVGVAEFRPGDTCASLVARADEAMYRAKNAGRNRVCVERGGEPEPAVAQPG